MIYIVVRNGEKVLMFSLQNVLKLVQCLMKYLRLYIGPGRLRPVVVQCPYKTSWRVWELYRRPPNTGWASARTEPTVWREWSECLSLFRWIFLKSKRKKSTLYRRCNGYLETVRERRAVFYVTMHYAGCMDSELSRVHFYQFFSLSMVT